MATTRFGYLDDLSLKNQKVGIGTSTANEKLEVLGGTRGGDVVVTGIATLTTYSGFQNKNTSYNENVNITGGESGTLSGEIVIGAGTTLSVGTGATTGQGSIKSLKVSNTFTPPFGGTNERPSAPQPGTLYYNKDFKTIEYWDGNFWRQVDNVTRSGRGVLSGGSAKSVIQYINIASQGNAIDFGNLTAARNGMVATSSNTRGCNGGGSPFQNTIDYITIASQGNAINFGDRSNTAYSCGGVSSSTRGVMAGGWTSPNQEEIDYIQFSTLGDAVDFGDLKPGATHGCPGCQSSVRGVFMGGYSSLAPDSNAPYYPARMIYLYMASKGNTKTFGELSVGRPRGGAGGNGVRGVCGGGTGNNGNSPYPPINVIDYITIASDGNAIDFGDMTRGSNDHPDGVSSNIRVCFCGGTDTTIDYITTATTGNALEFGELSSISYSRPAGLSDSHGGLGGF